MVVYEPKDVWFVWSKHGRRPTCAHATEVVAVAEAKRLAALVPGSKFLVMHATHKFSTYLGETS
jgi:hypothetical protein